MTFKPLSCWSIKCSNKKGALLFKEKDKVSTLDDALALTWRLLGKGVSKHTHPFNKPILTTVEKGKPRARIVILRDFSQTDRTLVCHCDVRSPKVSQICENPLVSWLFYDPEAWVQIRFYGTASIHTDDDFADCQWKTVRPASRANYSSTKAPGSPIHRSSVGLAKIIKEKTAGLMDQSKVRRNFAAVHCRFTEVDWLILRLTGNLRARFQWKDNRLNAYWIVP